MSTGKTQRKNAGLVLAGALTVLVASPSIAGTGCNHMVNPFVWGCAPWDNNNGPKFPYFHKKEVSVPIPKAGLHIEVKEGHAFTKVNGQLMPVVPASLLSHRGGSVISNDGGTLITNDGGTLKVWADNK